MFSAADLTETLLRRMRLNAHRMPPPGEFPTGWQAWFGRMAARIGAVTGATAEAVIGVLMQRPLVNPPRRVGDLSRWQAFATLWRQEWHPHAREERGLRWFAAIVSIIVHLFLGAMLIWLMYLRFLANSPPPPEGETVVMVEYIGKGTPEEVGGGTPAEPVEAVDEPATPEASAPESTAQRNVPELSAAVAAPVLESTVPEVPQRDVPEPQAPPVPPVEQAVAVSEPAPDTTDVFVLPPPTPRVRETATTVRELTAAVPPVRSVDVPEPVQPIPPIQREITPKPVTSPAISQRIPEVVARDIPAPVRREPVRELPAQPVAMPQVTAATPQVRTRDVPTPSKPVAPAPSAATALRPAATASVPTPAVKSAAKPAAPARDASATQSRPSPPTTATTAGSGPKATPAPGGWPTPARADDWGASARDRPAAKRREKPGLFNSDGSVRLGETPGSASPGNPPGTVTQEIANLDRAGTWLKRKPNDYEPTAFDQYWRPNESLLEEWVRKSISTVKIPIPGTNKHIVCQTVLLVVGGGCDISDPNLNEQPAVARPPPDIPFKPHLQEDNGSAKPGQ